jgi:hypothetical protein
MIARVSVVFALCACVAGCAAPGSSLTAVSDHDARDAITIGKSTKSDVIAALGTTAVVGFDSGFEVWVYQVTSGMPANLVWRKPGTAEFVVLFAPSGVVTKTRIRPPPPPPGTADRR